MDDFDIMGENNPTPDEQDIPAETASHKVTVSPVSDAEPKPDTTADLNIASESNAYNTPAANTASFAEDRTQYGAYQQSIPTPPQSPYTHPNAQTTSPYAGGQYNQPAYYQVPTAYSAPQSQPKKKNGGAVAFIIVLASLLLVFVIGFFSLIGFLMMQNRASDPNKWSHILPTEPDTSEASTLPDATEPSNAIPQTDGENVYTTKNSITLSSMPGDKSDTDKYTTQYAYKAICDSTVGIVCYDKNTRAVSAQGTGIIVSSDGYIVTNSHVIGDSRTSYNVQIVTSNNLTYEAKVIGYDTRTDLAVLKISATNLKSASFCDSDLVEIGQDVIAVGNPGGIKFQNSLTRGIVSALDRELDLSTQVSYIQTDAAINPGNSGGALCNLYGQVIGITSAKLNSSTYEGVGFAIPSRTVKEVVDDLMSQGYVNGRVRIGIVGTELSSGYSYNSGVDHGIIINEISENGPCYNTELKVNDIITSIDGNKISNFSEVFKLLQTHKEGDVITLGVYRPDTHKTLEIKITLMADNGETQQ